jgi:hypothetical protein
VLRDQVSQPCKTGGKIVVVFILIFVFLDRKLEDKIFYIKTCDGSSYEKRNQMELIKHITVTKLTCVGVIWSLVKNFVADK